MQTMTLKEFAKIVGMSQTTVSRALNGHPEVNENTRARLVQAAQQHGYAANAHAQFLATGNANIIGCVIPVTGRSELVNPIYADFLAGVGEECAARRFDINLSMVPDDEQAQAYRRLKSKGLIGGVIVQFPRHDDSRLRCWTVSACPMSCMVA
jgi:LacI family transcriptional regulator